MSSGLSPRRIQLALFLIGFATFALLYVVQPLLPALARDFAIGSAGSALALSVSTGTLALSIFLSALRGQHLDRRRLMLVAIALATLFNGVSAFCTAWWQLLLCRAAIGLCLGAVPATAMAYLADAVPPERLAGSMGLYVAGTALGGMTGRVGIAVLADLHGWREGLLTMSLLGMLAAMGIAWALPKAVPLGPPQSASLSDAVPHGAPSSPWRWIARHPRLPSLFLCGGLASGIFVAAYNYAGFRLLAAPFGLRPAQVGLIFCCYLCGVASSSLGGRLVSSMGAGRVLRGSCAITALGIGLSLFEHLAVFVAAMCLMTWGFFALHAVCSGWVGREAGAHKSQATASYLLSYYIGASVMGYAGGWLWDHGRWPWLCGGLALALLAFVGLLRGLASTREVHPSAGLAMK